MGSFHLIYFNVSMPMKIIKVGTPDIHLLINTYYMMVSNNYLKRDPVKVFNNKLGVNTGGQGGYFKMSSGSDNNSSFDMHVLVGMRMYLYDKLRADPVIIVF